jgi:hypothetical protein
VGALAAVPQKRQASSGSSPIAFFFARLRHIFD